MSAIGGKRTLAFRTRSCARPSITSGYTAVPTSMPIPAVAAIAAAPQKATRTVALRTGALPVRAPMAPSIARNSNDAADTVTIIDWPTGESHAATSGRDAPVVNVTADVNAAWIGRAVVI